MIHVCVPVLKRYDLLRELLLSLVESTAHPDVIHIVDNGRDSARLAAASAGLGFRTDIFTPDVPMGLAKSWNWFIDSAQEERLIVNDDITFAPESIAKMLSASASFVSCTFGFSCFLLRDSCVQQVGYFDEDISPGYAYFEDMDYLRRMRLAGVADAVIQCGVTHHQSATLEKYSSKELDAHHEKFNLAQKNYMAKWSSEPSWEQLKAIGGNGVHQ